MAQLLFQILRILKSLSSGSKWIEADPELAHSALEVVWALWQQATTDVVRHQPDFWTMIFQVWLILYFCSEIPAAPFLWQEDPFQQLLGTRVPQLDLPNPAAGRAESPLLLIISRLFHLRF